MRGRHESDRHDRGDQRDAADEPIDAVHEVDRVHERRQADRRDDEGGDAAERPGAVADPDGERRLQHACDDRGGRQLREVLAEDAGVADVVEQTDRAQAERRQDDDRGLSVRPARGAEPADTVPTPMPSPPIRGVGTSCELRSFGMSSRFSLPRESFDHAGHDRGRDAPRRGVR